MSSPATFHIGARVEVRLPIDVAGWSVPEGAHFVGILVSINGDSLDIRTPAGDVEPFDAELCQQIAE